MILADCSHQLLYEAWGIDSWLFDLVFTDAQQPDGKESLKTHIEEHLLDERESLQTKEPLETSEDFIPFNIGEEKDSLKQVLKKIAKAFTHHDNATLFTPLSLQEQAWLQEELITRFLPNRNGDNSQLLLNAVESNNLAHCRAILAITDLPADILAAQNTYDMNALMSTIHLWHPNIASTILAREDLPDEVLTNEDDDGRNTLTLAISRGYTELVSTVASQLINRNLLTLSNRIALFFSGYFKLAFSWNKLVIDNSRMPPAGSVTDASTPEPVVGSKKGGVSKYPNHTRKGPE